MTLKQSYLRRFVALCGILLMGTVLNLDCSYGASLLISWNPNRESDLNGYRVYYGTSSNSYAAFIDVGNRTSYEITGLNPGTRYFVSLTAYDTSRNESAKSIEASGFARDGSTTTSSTGTTSTVTGTTTGPATTSLPGTSTVATTTIPGSTTIPPNTTSTTVPGITTTSSVPDEASSCEDPQKLTPLSVEASSEAAPFFGKDNLIDGDPRTTWSTVLSFFRKDAFITLDFGGIKSISTLSMYATRMFGIDFLPANIELRTSNDNRTWESINPGVGYSSLQPPYADSWRLSGQQCRYLKICISGRRGLFLFQIAQIAELEVFGCDPAGSLPLQVLAESTADDRSLDAARSMSEDKNSSVTVTPSIPGKPQVSFH